jgi:hypothetical protein
VRTRWLWGACAVTALVGVTTDVHANGRFPKAQIVLTRPGGDGRELVMRTTFGLLFSSDGGGHFRWLCESALGFTGTWDPPISFGRDGRVFVGLERGLRVTRGGCGVRPVAELEGELVSDLTLMPDAVHVAVATSTANQPARFWVETPSGRFERRGAGPDGLSFETIDVSPADENRVYVTGIDYTQKPLARLLRSDDGGRNFRELRPSMPHDGHVFISHLDPKNRDRLVLRQITSSGSAVLVSTDGGANFRETHTSHFGLYGFAAAEDGASLFVASGSAEEGVYISDDRGDSWHAGVKEGFLCLHVRRNTLYACSNPYVRGGYALGRSRDHGRTMTQFAGFGDISGPVACDAGPNCGEEWAKTQSLLGPNEPPEEPEVGASDGGAADPRADASIAALSSAPAAATLRRASGTPTRSACACGLAEPQPGRRLPSGRHWASAVLACFVFAWRRAVQRQRLDRQASIRRLPRVG